MDNANKDKISEKVIWENYNPDNDLTSVSNVVLNQQQVMLCYNCNKVIPDNSKFCPWCQIELYTECPKCGNKYSSQYPACNKCGTNKNEYLLEQKRLEQLREKELRRQEEEKRQQKIADERTRMEIKVIRDSAPYCMTYRYLEKQMKISKIKFLLKGSILYIIFLLFGFLQGLDVEDIAGAFEFAIIIGVGIGVLYWPAFLYMYNGCPNIDTFEQYLISHRDKEDKNIKSMMNYVIIRLNKHASNRGIDSPNSVKEVIDDCILWAYYSTYGPPQLS